MSKDVVVEAIGGVMAIIAVSHAELTKLNVTTSCQPRATRPRLIAIGATASPATGSIVCTCAAATAGISS